MTKLHTVELDRDKYHLHNEMRKWCEEHFGEGRWYRTGVERVLSDTQWFESEIFGHYTYWFRNQADAVFFSLQWS